METTNMGLLLNFFGTVVVGVSSQLGLATGWGGPINWRRPCWRHANLVGWILLALGFLLQLFARDIDAFIVATLR
jgi:hypothetical protein